MGCVQGTFKFVVSHTEMCVAWTFLFVAGISEVGQPFGTESLNHGV